MRTSALFLLVSVVHSPLWAESPPQLSEKALALVRDLRATKMGIDREENLWTWQFPSGRLDLYSSSGEVVASTSLQDVLDLDVDRRWGIAAILSPGREVRLVPWGAGATSILLPDDVGGIAWIDAEIVAVAPTMANHRAQVWNMREKSLVQKLGAEEEIVPKIGATALRAVRLKYHPGRKLLYTLDSFRGDLQVFALDGRLVRHETFPPVEKRDSEAWLAKTDREMRERREVFTPAIWWFDMAVDAAGTAWSIPDCDGAQGLATLLQIPLIGKHRSAVVETPCCARGLVIWNGWLILHSDPAPGRKMCNLIRRFP
jgi:hypothetical protein